MNNKIFNTKNTKIATKKLKDYAYVMNLTSLTPIEKNILSKKYVDRVYKRFPLACGKVKTLDMVSFKIQQTLHKVEKFIKEHNLQNVTIDSRYQRNSLTVMGTKFISDHLLIQRLKADVKRIKKINDAIAERNKRAKQQMSDLRAADAKRLAEQKKHTKTVVICTIDDAKEIISQLKSRFNL